MPEPLLSMTDTFRRAYDLAKNGDPGALTPGTVLLGRYRIVKILGRGGMAEVYQADDLKLREPVALKFLFSPKTTPKALERLNDEVRHGRRVTHENVCRIYDIVEDGDRHFITMEFVAGVDLASLLLQVGRLPFEKALQVSRDLCAGVAAAHEVGLIHRDLKPANIMINGFGTPKITDFGIAAYSTEISPDDRSGTPNYMAPEQLIGGGGSVESDLYALGLVMYELFTGRPVFSAETIAELIAAHQVEKRPPSSTLADIDMNVERVILKCLDEDPAQRPRSVRDILAALPGLDAVDAAMVRGETPRPGLVASKNVPSTLSGVAALVLFAAVISGLAAILFLTPMTMFYARVPLDKPPEVLGADAERMATQIGMTTSGLRRYSWFERDEDALRARPWEDLPRHVPGAMSFVSYWAPQALTAQNATSRFQFASSVILAHLNQVTLDSDGRLKSFRFGDSGAPRSSRLIPFGTLLPLAGVVDAVTVPIRRFGMKDGSERIEWLTRGGNEPGLHVVTTTRGDSLSGFVVTPSGVPSAARGSAYAAELGLAPAWGGAALVIAIIGIVLTGIAMMLRNVRRDRLDRLGAMKVATYAALVTALAWACAADHSARLLDEWLLVKAGLGSALFAGAIVWLFYAALEPSLRRRSPDILVGWQRLLQGWFGDSLIAHDVLIAIVIGISWNLWWRLINLSPVLLRLRTLVPLGDLFDAFSSVRGIGFRFFSVQYTAVFFGLGVVFILNSWLTLVRRPSIAFVASGALMTMIAFPSVPSVNPHDVWFAALFSVAITASWLWVAWRFGLLTLIVAIFVHFQLCAFPLTLDVGSWFAGRSWLAMAALVATAMWAAFGALKSRSDVVA